MKAQDQATVEAARAVLVSAAERMEKGAATGTPFDPNPQLAAIHNALTRESDAIRTALSALTAAEEEMEHYRNNGHQQALRARDAEARATVSEARATRLEEAVEQSEGRAAQASVILSAALKETDLGTVRAFIKAAHDFTSNDTEALAEGSALAPPTTSKPEGGA